MDGRQNVDGSLFEVYGSRSFLTIKLKLQS